MSTERRKACQRCPKCNIRIYLNVRLYFACPVHGEYKLNYATGKLEEVLKKNPPC
jgi:hypothetical protein